MTSAAFTLTGAAGSLLKLQTTATTSVVATLDSLDGVRSVAWSIKGSDETGGTYTLTPSGTYGSVCTTTSKAAGTAFILQCVVNGGVDGNGTSVPAYTKTAKVWVPATGTGLEVGCVGEDDESSPTYGWTGIINSAVRNVATGGVTSVTGTPPIASSGGATPAISITAATTVAAGSMSAADKTKLDDATSAATADKLVLRGGSAEAAFGYVSVGSGTMATTGTIRSGSSFNVVARDGGVDRNVIAIDGSDTMTIGDTTNVALLEVRAADASLLAGGTATVSGSGAGVVVSAPAAGGAITMQVDSGGSLGQLTLDGSADTLTCSLAGTQRWQTTTSAFSLGVNALSWTVGSTPTIQQTARTTNAAAAELIIASQSPYASATLTNRDAKRIRLQVPSPAGGGAESYVGIEISGAERAQVGRYSAIFNDGNSGKPVRIGAQYNAGVESLNYAAIYFGSNASSPAAATYAILGDNADTYVNAPSGTLCLLKAGSALVTLTESGGMFSVSISPTSTPLVLTSAATAAAITANRAQALTISIGTQTADSVSPKDLTLTPGQPYASATGVYRKPGNLVQALGAPTNSGTTHAQVLTTRGASSSIILDKGEVTTTDATSTVVYTYTLADTTAVHLRARMVSFRTDSGTNCNVNVLEAGAKRRGGGATLVGTPTTVLKEDAGFTSFTATVSGNDLRVEVQARGAETWKHRVHVEIVAEVIT